MSATTAAALPVIHGDCREVMATFALSSFDAIVTDPPYELGFMGKAWDRSGVAFNPMTWRYALSVTKPGGYLLAFGGTRTFHRLTCAIEDAGWEIHDCLCWLYGSGFPKHDSKLKPAWEPIIMARRPAPSATALNINACRIGFASEADRVAAFPGGRTTSHGAGSLAGPGAAQDVDRSEFAAERNPIGRWPANVVVDEEAAAALDEQSGVLTSGANPTRRGSPKTRNTYGTFEGQEECTPLRGVDVGGASRFYYCAKVSRAEREAGLDGFSNEPLNWSSGSANPGSFQSEGTDKTARNNHPTVKPIALMRWLCRLVTPAGGSILDPFTGSGSTGCAAALEGFRFTGIEGIENHVVIANARIAHWSGRAAASPEQEERNND